jgi:hypothetical protein
MIEDKRLAEAGYLQFLMDNGYLVPTPLPNGRWMAILPLMFTYAIVTGRTGDTSGYDNRWCYPTLAQAVVAIATWDGMGDPPDGWIRQPGTGRRRPDGDPAAEYVAF